MIYTLPKSKFYRFKISPRIQAVQTTENLVNLDQVCPNKSRFQCSQAQNSQFVQVAVALQSFYRLCSSSLYLIQPVNVPSQVRPSMPECNSPSAA